MESTKKVTIMWTVYEDEGYWRYTYGNEKGIIATSPRIMTRDMALKALNKEVDLLKRQYGDSTELIVREMKM